MRNFKKLFLIAGLFGLGCMAAGSAAATQSTINASQPAQGAPLSSSALRQNFQAAQNDINNIYATLSTLGNLPVYGTSLLNAPDAASAQSILNLTPGVNVQAYSALLGAVAAVASGSDKCLYFTGSAAADVFTCTAFGRSLAGSGNAAAAQALLTLTPGTNVQAYSAILAGVSAIDGGSGLLEQTGASAFAKRALGVGASTSVPTRADADARYAALSHTHAISDITSLQASLDAKQTAIQFKDEGVGIGTSGGVSSVNCVGAGVVCGVSSGALTMTISGGGGGGGGGITGPVSSTDTAIALWNGSGGDTLQDSVITVSGTGDMGGLGNLTPATGKALRTAASAGNTLLLQARDVDGAAYTTFATLTANNTPTMDLSTAVTMGGNALYYASGPDVAVADGGTNLSSYTQGDILYASAGTTLSKLAKDTNATRYLSNTGSSNNPAWAQIALTTGVSGILPVANGGTNNAFFTVSGPASSAKTYTLPNADSTILTSNAAVTVAQGGTGLASGTSGGILGFTGSTTLASSGALTANALLLGGGAGATPSALGSLGTTTTLLHGNAAGAPTFGAVSLTADVSGILPVANGGTNNAFFTVSGPASSAKTYTLPNATTTILTTNAAVSVAQGGTGQTSYTDGQLLIGATSGNTLAKATLTAPAAGIGIANATSSITFSLTNDLAALEGLSSTGIAVRTATDTWAQRTITGGGGVTLTNGDGVSGNPTLSVSNLRTLWIPAAAMRPTSSNGCAPLALVASGADEPDISSLDFDAATKQYAQFQVRLPKGWNAGTVTAAFVWSHPSTTTNFKVSWGIQGVSIADNEAMGVAYGTAQTAFDTGGITDRQYISPVTSAVTLAGTPAAGEVQYFRIYRDAADATNDTLAVNARLQGVLIFYTISTLDDT